MIAFGCLLATIGIYWGSKRLYRAIPLVYLTPLLVTPAIVIGLLVCTNIPYATYHAGARWLSEMIGPATVAFAVPLYKHIAVLKRHAAEIVVSALFGACLGVLSSAWMAERLSLNMQIVESLAPRSATTPIAMAVSQSLGGIPNVTAVFVLLTGLIGMIIGPPLVRSLRINNDIARGVLFGTGAHNAGTAKAFEFSSVSGTISSIAMILTAFFTLGVAPWLMK